MDNCDQESPIVDDIKSDPEETCQVHEIDQLIINCVKTNNLRFLDLLLYEPDSHLDCIYFGENMLMLAIRMDYEEIAKFLIENGVNHNFEKKIFYTTMTDEGEIIDYYSINCREMAYRHSMFEVVEMIDYLNEEYFRFYPVQKFQIRDRSEKPGMFHDVISLHEEFFTNDKIPSVKNTKKSTSNITDIVTVNSLNPKSDNVIRSRSANIERLLVHTQTKENKSSFLRRRTTSAKSKTDRKSNDSSETFLTIPKDNN